MNTDELRDFLLASIPGAKSVSGGKEVLVRCPRCGDSKNLSSAHFYIGLGDTNNPPMYHCKKCNEGGIFNFEKLRWFDIYDSNFGLALNNHIKELNIKTGYKLTNSFIDIFNISHAKTTGDDLTNAKLEYINSRLDLNLSFEECQNKKIILNLSDILNENHIVNYTRHINVMNELDKNFIGFLSYDNGFLNMRDIGNSNMFNGKRYINYNIFNKLDNSKRYYILPTNINLLDSKPIKIRIAEGPFDILSIYYNVVQEDNNNIYSSIGGKSYLNIIKFYLENLGLINIEIHLYPDKDIENYMLSKIIRYLGPFNIPIYIHRNMFQGEKDYGVPKSRIIDTIIKL